MSHLRNSSSAVILTLSNAKGKSPRISSLLQHLLPAPPPRVPHPLRRLNRRNGWGIERSSIAFIALATTLTAAILYRFPPERYPFYPVCPIHQYLHLECPGCGTTRALSALLHGHLIAAIHLNALTILVLLPLAAIYALFCLNRSHNNAPFRLSRPAIIALSILTAAFTLFRNL